MRVAVIFGGESCEHDISMITGVQLISNMNNSISNIKHKNCKAKFKQSTTLNFLFHLSSFLVLL